MSAYDDYQADPIAGYTGSYVNEGDASDAWKMAPYTPSVAGNESAPWWQNIVAYGVTKAIDNTFPNQNTGIQGNTRPGSFAGQNGQTYNQVGGLNSAPYRAGGGTIAGMSPLMLGLLAVGAYLLLKK